MSETLTEYLTVNLTPALKQRLQDFADQKNWRVSAAIRYFIQDGLEGAARRDALGQEAGASWPPKDASGPVPIQRAS